MRPERIVIGASNNRAFNAITELYRPLNAHIIFTSVKNAELIKYVSNAFLATKISFINEIANICERVGADVTEVAYAIGLDSRIGREFLNAGLGYGGSCLPKDVLALIHLARENGYDPELLNSVTEINQYQIDAFVGKISKGIKNLRGKVIAVLGLSFKPETDDLRDAPALRIIRGLQEKGAKVRIYDPALRNKSIPGIDLCNDLYAALKNAEAMVLATEWAEFREIDFERVKKLLKKPLIFDGRNIYDPKKMKELGFVYHGVGR
jgi:UDPglucose 6-dehydrogenase